MVPGRKFSTTASAVSSRASKIARSSSCFRLSAMLSLPRLIDWKYADLPLTNGP